MRSTGRDRLGNPSSKSQIDKAGPQYEPGKPVLPDTFIASRVLLHKQLEQIHLENLTWGTFTFRGQPQVEKDGIELSKCFPAYVVKTGTLARLDWLGLAFLFLDPPRPYPHIAHLAKPGCGRIRLQLARISSTP